MRSRDGSFRSQGGLVYNSLSVHAHFSAGKITGRIYDFIPCAYIGIRAEWARFKKWFNSVMPEISLLRKQGKQNQILSQ